MAMFVTVTAAADLLLAAPLPTPHLSDPNAASEVDADLVTPGLLGFLTLFLSAIAVFFLGRSMARRVQRVNHRARLAAATEAENQNSDDREDNDDREDSGEEPAARAATTPDAPDPRD